MLGQVILFLLFIGAERVVNRIAGRPMMNGALWYLLAAAIFFVVGILQASSFSLPDDSRENARMYGHIFGSMCGAFLLPVGVGIYYAEKFARAKAASSAGSTPVSP